VTCIDWDGWDPSKPVPAPWAGFANSKRTNGTENEMTEPQEILNVMSRYCRAVDDRKFDAMAELLAEDVRFEMGDVTESRSELLEYIQANLWPAGRHIYANPDVSVDGDTAHVESDWIWLNPNLVPTRSGRYSDDLRRIDGRWVFTVRRISIAFDREAPEIG
jgi:SnoaL-like protein